MSGNQIPNIPLVGAAVRDGRIRVATGGYWLSLDGGLDPAAEADMKAEVLSTAIEGDYVEAVGRGGGGSRGISLRGDQLVAWVERGGRREVILDVLLDRHSAELVFEALKRLEDGAQFDLLFNVLTNAEMCAGVDGRVHFCDEGFDYVVGGRGLVGI